MGVEIIWKVFIICPLNKKNFVDFTIKCTKGIRNKNDKSTFMPKVLIEVCSTGKCSMQQYKDCWKCFV